MILTNNPDLPQSFTTGSHVFYITFVIRVAASISDHIGPVPILRITTSMLWIRSHLQLTTLIAKGIGRNQKTVPTLMLVRTPLLDTLVLRRQIAPSSHVGDPITTTSPFTYICITFHLHRHLYRLQRHSWRHQALVRLISTKLRILRCSDHVQTMVMWIRAH